MFKWRVVLAFDCCDKHLKLSGYDERRFIILEIPVCDPAHPCLLDVCGRVR